MNVGRASRIVTAPRRWLRRGAVAGSLAFFGVGGAWLSHVWLPLAVRRARDDEEATALAQRAVRRGFVVFMTWTRVLRLIDFDRRGTRPRVPAGPFVLVANHPTILDVVAIGSVHDRLSCIVKDSYFDNPLLAPLLRRCRFIDGGEATHSSLERVIEEGVERLAAGQPLLVFAEGTRSPMGDLHPLKRAGFEIAARAGAPIVPLFVDVRPQVMTKQVPWYRFPDTFVAYRLSWLDPIDPPVGRKGVREAMATVERLFRQHLGAEVVTSPRTEHGPNPPSAT
jgi:1-acyl-sn-glycerol-3-phosphate acyltransferase